jgi:hypothetical protein
MIIGASTINNINNGAFTITHPTQTSLSIFNDGRLMLYNNRPTSLNSTSLYLDYPLTIRHINGNNDTRSGIAFGATNIENQTPGSAIWFTRTNANSLGDLVFLTKNDPVAGGALFARMTIKNDGRIGIGTSTPSQVLDVNGVANASNYTENGISISTKYAMSNTLSNVNSNLTTLSNHFWTFSNTMSSNITTLSNALSNCCFTGSANLATVSIWTDTIFRKKSVNVPWSEISGKPNFGTSNNSIDFVGVALGATGLLFGGAALLNQNGQLVSALQNVAGTIKLNPSGYSRLDEGLQLLGDGTNGITLDPSGSINALTGAFNYSRFTQGVDIGLATMSLSNDQIFWKNGATSNMILGSNALTVLNNQPFTIILSNGKLGIGQSNPSTTLALRGNDYSPGWFAEEVFIGSSTYPSFQNLRGSALALNFDCHWAPVYKSSSSNNNYQIRKGEGILLVRYSSNIPIGSNLNFETSMVWNTNGNVGVKMTNPEYELDVNGTANLRTKYGVMNTYNYKNKHTTKSKT